MSLLFITDHDEVIYDAIESRKKIRSKPPQYPNYLDLALQLGDRIIKKQHATMGPAEYFPPNPQEFLRKTSKRNFKKEKGNKFERHCTIQDKKPPLVQEGAKIVHRNVNFVKVNKNKITELKPREHKEKYVLTKYGDKVDANILEPHHVHLKNFGKYPRYLLQNQNNRAKMLQSIKDEKELNRLSNCRYITRPERDGLLNGLKQNWDEKQKEFQLLPMITDTIPKRNRKLQIEKELKVLEKDILLIEKHPYIYVINDE